MSIFDMGKNSRFPLGHHFMKADPTASAGWIGEQNGQLDWTDSMMYKMRTTSYHEWMPLLYALSKGLKRIEPKLHREEIVAFIIHLERTALELREQIGEV